MMYTSTLFEQPGGEYCPCCGQRVRKLNPHSMDFSKVKVLEEFARLCMRHEWVKNQRDPALVVEGEPTILTDDVHVYRLCWFGLMETKERRSGLYKVTPLGLAFLAGVADIPERIWCKGGRVVQESPTRVKVGDVRNVILDRQFWDSYWMQQQEE